MEHATDPTTRRLFETLTAYPAAQADFLALASEAVVPHTDAGRSALARQLLAALARHLRTPGLARLAMVLGGFAETTGDVDELARLAADPDRSRERGVLTLMLDALVPNPLGLAAAVSQLAPAMGSAGAAYDVALVWASLPRHRKPVKALYTAAEATGAFGLAPLTFQRKLRRREIPAVSLSEQSHYLALATLDARTGGLHAYHGPEQLTQREAALALGVAPSTVHRAVQRGFVPTVYGRVPGWWIRQLIEPSLTVEDLR